MPIYDMICTNEDCKHEEKNVVCKYEKRDEQFCPKCGAKMSTDYSTFKHTLIGAN